MAAKTPAPPPSPVAQFETSLDELEQLVQKMEKGDLSLDDSLAAYERGVNLYRQCQGALTTYTISPICWRKIMPVLSHSRRPSWILGPART